MTDIPSLSIETIASGVVGLLIIGAIVKQAMGGWSEARKHIKAEASNPIISAVAAAWDRDEKERLLVFVERIAVAVEKQAGAQLDMVNQQTQDMREKIEWLIEEMKSKPRMPSRRRPKRKPGG